MILDSLGNCANYAKLHPLFERAFTYLRTENFETLAHGRYELEGDQLFAIVSETSGVAKEEAKMEVHQKYLDIQYIISGTDHMGWRPLAFCEEVFKPYDAEKDFALYADKTETWFDVPAGFFTIFFPSDAHAPMTTIEVVRKVVIKVAV